jgi:hypothetical protein
LIPSKESAAKATMDRFILMHLRNDNAAIGQRE